MESQMIWSLIEREILWWVICAIFASVIGAKKGRPILGFLLGFLCGPIGILITLLIKGNRRECPRCMERIHKKASICPHCRAEIPTSQRQLQLTNWIFGIVIAIGALLCTAGIIVYLDEQPQRIITSNTAAKPKQVFQPSHRSDSGQETSKPATLHKVTYWVTFSLEADHAIPGQMGIAEMSWQGNLTYTNEQGGASQESGAKLPWSKTFLAEPGARLYISAQEGGGARTGAITVSIYVDERLAKTSTSKGAYTIATASVRI